MTKALEAHYELIRVLTERLASPCGNQVEMSLEAQSETVSQVG